MAVGGFEMTKLFCFVGQICNLRRICNPPLRTLCASGERRLQIGAPDTILPHLKPVILIAFAVTAAAQPATHFRFNFGDAPDAPGFTLVAPDAMYTKERG